VARRLIFGNRRAECGGDVSPLLIDHAGIWTSGAAKKCQVGQQLLV
jgi:hypothetical protein